MLEWVVEGYGWAWLGYLFVVLLPTAIFVIPFGAYPLLVDRRLRKAGVAVTSVCTDASWSEGRVSEEFHFTTLDGLGAFYRSPLADGRMCRDGERVGIVYDPRAPHRRARTEIELSRKSPARRDLGCGLLLLLLLHVLMLPFVILFAL
ncbi:hypothetical protein [Streptomyces sp. C36]|uniref:hypothetical protein n=1 Tax=Streptomyces sp. C36 TaxID=3237122 RepID=UPI0034C676C9